jgi:hypothetical protein
VHPDFSGHTNLLSGEEHLWILVELGADVIPDDHGKAVRIWVIRPQVQERRLSTDVFRIRRASDRTSDGFLVALVLGGFVPGDRCGAVRLRN